MVDDKIEKQMDNLGSSRNCNPISFYVGWSKAWSVFPIVEEVYSEEKR